MGVVHVELDVTPAPPAGTVKFWVTTAVASPSDPRRRGLSTTPVWDSTKLIHTTDVVPVPDGSGVWLKVTAIHTNPGTAVTTVIGTAVLKRCPAADAATECPLFCMRVGSSQDEIDNNPARVQDMALKLVLPTGADAGLCVCDAESEATPELGVGGTMIETAWPVPTTAATGWAMLGLDIYDSANHARAFQHGVVSYFYRALVLLAAGQTKKADVTMHAIVRQLAADVVRDALTKSTTTLDALAAAMLQGAGGDYHSETADDRGHTLLTFGTNVDCDDFACSVVIFANTFLRTWCQIREFGLLCWPERDAKALNFDQDAMALLRATGDYLYTTYREGCVVYGVSESPSRPQAGQFGHAWAALIKRCPAHTYNLAGALHLECTAPLTTGVVPGLPGNARPSVVAQQVAQAKAAGCGIPKQALYAGTRVADAAAMATFYPQFFRAVFAGAVVYPLQQADQGPASWQDMRLARVAARTVTAGPESKNAALRCALYHRVANMLPNRMSTGVTTLSRLSTVAVSWAALKPEAPAAPDDKLVSWDNNHSHWIRSRLAV